MFSFGDMGLGPKICRTRLRSLYKSNYLFWINFTPLDSLLSPTLWKPTNLQCEKFQHSTFVENGFYYRYHRKSKWLTLFSPFWSDMCSQMFSKLHFNIFFVILYFIFIILSCVKVHSNQLFKAELWYIKSCLKVLMLAVFSLRKRFHVSFK